MSLGSIRFLSAVCGRCGVRFFHEAGLLAGAGLVAVATLSAAGQWYPAGREAGRHARPGAGAL
jgi:hypothetical protein